MSTDTHYSGIMIAGVTVTVNDNDTAQVTEVSVTAGNAQLVVSWTAVDNATGYKVQWKSGSENYNDTNRQATITSGSTTSHTIPNLTNGVAYAVQVIATRIDANDGLPSTEVPGTPAMPTTPGVTVSKTALTVREEATTGDSYTVVLDTQPTADVTVTVAVHCGHERDPGSPIDPDIHHVELEHGPDGDGYRRQRCGPDERYGHADPQRDERGHQLQRHHD